MTYFGNQLSSLLSTPIQLVIGIVIMWFFIGISFLAGLITTVIMIWITFIVSKYTIKYNSEVLKAKDNRMKATQEMLENIRFIKINAL
jgi:ABC-type bacteriocin/lantibiotic exporter with double-glycine peptidase domain